MRDPQITSKIMSSVKSRDTRPEMVLRSALWHRGLRFRVRYRVTGRPDIVFPGPRVAVFVDGDFWHGNSWRVRGMSSFEAQFERMNNAEFWRAKIIGNMLRDERVAQDLADADWTVYRVFESRLKTDLASVVDEIEQLVRSKAASRRRQSTTSPEESNGILVDGSGEGKCRDQ
ncbi:very short patch repair endonuclease [Parafrankia sp. EUN1f]|uniref:very short patch repair endonuclease n=1 Tax=Parafrankia sp. EUN1f TaxID=102897 RepID=UPI0009FC6507|nr:very short patch repair endonuclease [Parafrankia sp. EUN1f]